MGFCGLILDAEANEPEMDKDRHRFWGWEKPHKANEEGSPPSAALQRRTGTQNTGFAPQVAQPQRLKRTTWKPHRACTGVTPDLHRADTHTQSHIANFVNHLISEPCAINVRPPPDRRHAAWPAAKRPFDSDFRAASLPGDQWP